MNTDSIHRDTDNTNSFGENPSQTENTRLFGFILNETDSYVTQIEPAEIIYNTKNEVNTYYSNFSKYILNKPSTNVETNNPKFTYNDFIKTTKQYSKEFDFEKYKLLDLKNVAKHYKLQVSGNKPVVIHRIRTFFHQTTATTLIQRVFRGHIVRYCRKLRGPAFRNRLLCVNDTEFYTLDPIRNIPDELFFSFTDSQNYVYGFDVCSIISLITKSDKPKNPYNREEFPYNAMVALHRLYNITRILFPTINHYEQNETTPYSKITNTLRTTAGTDTTDYINTIFQSLNTRSLGNVSVPNVSRNQIVTQQADLNRSLETIRSQPLETRVRELFMEINLLGNYAESSWFTNLNRLRLARYYQFYYDWWYVRSRLSSDTRNKICMLDDPFSDVNLLYMYPTTTLEDFREACVRLMENMVYGSLDIEYRKLGALHLLSVLTIVSDEARVAMPWLFDSIA